MADATVDEVAVYFASTTTVSPDADITLTVNSVTEKGEICSQQNDSLIKLSIRFRIKHCYCICEFCHQINKIRIIFTDNQSSKIFIIFFIINNLRKKEIFIMFCINAKPKMEKTMPHFLHSIPRFTNIKKSRFIFRKEFFNYSQNCCSYFTVTR